MSKYRLDIFDAADRGTVEDVKYFIEEKGVSVNAKQENFTIGATPLHKAAFGGNIEVAKYLISKGADINDTCDEGLTPLHYTALDTGKTEEDDGKVKVAKLLVSKGADINAKTLRGNTPLDISENEGPYELTQYLKSIDCLNIGKIIKYIAIGIGVIIVISIIGNC